MLIESFDSHIRCAISIIVDAIGLSNLPRQLINKNVVNMILEGDEDSSWCLLKCLFDLHVSAAKLLKQSINRNQNIIEEQKNFY